MGSCSGSSSGSSIRKRKIFEGSIFKYWDIANFFFYTPCIIPQQNHSRENTFTKEFVVFLIYQDWIEQYRVEDWKSSIIEQTALEVLKCS